MNFKQAYNGILVIAGICYLGNVCYQAYQEEQSYQAQQAAADWRREMLGRVGKVVDLALANRVSTEDYIETLTAAKNVISFEADEALPDNIYRGEAVRNLHEHIDSLIAIMKAI